MFKSILPIRNVTPLILSGLTVLGVNAQQKVEKASTDAPNLIYIISDQLRLSALSCMGNTVISTPNMDKLASEGVIFTRAYSQCPVSVPSRSSMLTGNSLCNTGILGNGYAYESSTGSLLTGNEPIFSTDTYDEVLAKNGYDCEYYGKWHSPERKAYVYSNRPIGCAGITSVPVLGIGLAKIYTVWWQEQLKVTSAPNFKTGAISITPKTDGSVNPTVSLYYMPDQADPRFTTPTLPNSSINDYQTFGETLIDSMHTTSAMDCDEVLATIEKDKNVKFSIHCSFGPPHPPFVVAKPYYGSLKESDMPIPASYFVNSASSSYYNANELNSPYFKTGSGSTGMSWVQSVSAIQNFEARYYEMIKEIDAQLGLIMNKLDSLGLTNKTMIVFCADHGEMLGSHGMNSKNVFYDESARVPLIMRFPGKISAGKRITTPVNLIDIRPTIEDYLGMPAYKCDGKTLRPFIEDSYDKNQEYFAVSEWSAAAVPGFMVRNEQFKLMIGQTTVAAATDGFYDLKADSLEQNNLYKITPLSAINRANAEKAKVQLISWLKKVNSPYYYSVKARAIGKKYSTYALYKNDVAKINGATITAMTGLPTGVSYRILPNDTIAITVTNAATTGVLNINCTVNGASKSLSFEILPAFDLSTGINTPNVSEHPFLIRQSDNNISVSLFSEDKKSSNLELYTIQGILVKQIRIENNQASFSTDPLPKGLYFVRATQNSKIYSEKLIIK